VTILFCCFHRLQDDEEGDLLASAADAQSTRFAVLSKTNDITKAGALLAVGLFSNGSATVDECMFHKITII